MERKKRRLQISIGFKLVFAIILTTLLSTAFLLGTLLPKFREITKEMVTNNMLTITNAYEKTLELQLQREEETYELFADILGNAKLVGVESSYAYLVDNQGIMLYHPTKEKVGESVENEVVKGLVEKLKKGETPQNDAVSYIFKGTTKYASYAILSNQYILVVTADEANVFEPITTISNFATKAGIGLVCVFAIFGFFLSLLIVIPIRKITKIILDTAKFDLRENKNMRKLCRHMDETGMMARAVDEMTDNLRDMVQNIESACQEITGNVDNLQDISDNVNRMCSDNSATTEELAASMEETAATTETIASNISVMEENASGIEDLSVKSEKNSKEILTRADNLKNSARDSIKKANVIYSDIKNKSEQAIEDSKAVSKINELTNSIMAISSQTGMLALNASIEAARAGEAGRGFAVVATEIGNLSGQTAQTVGNINTIVEEVNKAVHNMQQTLQEAMKFLEEDVTADYNRFSEVSEQYSDDALTFQQNMGEVYTSINQLTGNIRQVSNAIAGINSTVNEATIGVTEIAGKTTDVVGKTETNFELTKDCLTQVSKLKALIEQFVLQ